MFNSFVSCCLASVAFAASGTFDYKQNGADWGSLDGNSLCDDGREQSPINLNDWYTEYSEELNIHLKPNTHIDETTAIIENKGDTIHVTTTQGEMELTFDSGSSSEFKLAQFHVHAPSEHTVDSEHYDLEMHFVHTYMDGSLGAVIGVFFDQEEGGDGDNMFIDQLNAIWSGAGTVRTNQRVNVEGFLDSLDMSSFWSYDGSLTTPPCTEGIKWSVLKQVQPISAAQLKRFTALWADKQSYAEGKGNNRVTQALNGRDVMVPGWSDPVYVDVTIAMAVMFALALSCITAMCCALKCYPEKLGYEVYVAPAKGSTSINRD